MTRHVNVHVMSMPNYYTSQSSGIWILSQANTEMLFINNKWQNKNNVGGWMGEKSGTKQY